ncbi:MAG: DUF4332 domain-containing protein [Fibrobacterales bacterium]
MAYHVDLSTVTIENFQSKLEDGYLPPSRMILKEKIASRFDSFKKMDITNVNELLSLLKNKEKLSDLNKKNLFADDYLKILLREIKSLQPKPINLSDFPGVADDTIACLGNVGIKKSHQLYAKIYTEECRRKLALDSGVVYAEILELTRLTDLSRIKWVGATFARLLFDLGFDSVVKVSQAESNDLHTRLNQLIKSENTFRGQIGLNDVRICMSEAKDLPMDVIE